MQGFSGISLHSPTDDTTAPADDAMRRGKRKGELSHTNCRGCMGMVTTTALPIASHSVINIRTSPEYRSEVHVRVR